VQKGSIVNSTRTRSSIVLIDRHETDRNYFAGRLRLSFPDHSIIEAGTGQAGLLVCQSEPVDCVILELDLSDLSGFQVLITLVPVTRRPMLPVIVLTRLAQPGLLDLALRNGAQAAFRKSLMSGDLLEQTVLKAMAMTPLTRKDTLWDDWLGSRQPRRDS